MMRIVLDAGALVALDRGDRKVWSALRVTQRRASAVIVPTTALAQAWRGGARQALLARAIENCEIASFDEVAREVGVLCGRARTDDVCDAHVALVAAARADILYTSDVLDLRHLLRIIDSDIAIVAC